MDNSRISCQVMADMKKVYDDLIIITLYVTAFFICKKNYDQLRDKSLVSHFLFCIVIQLLRFNSYLAISFLCLGASRDTIVKFLHILQKIPIENHQIFVCSMNFGFEYILYILTIATASKTNWILKSCRTNHHFKKSRL